MPPQTSSPFFDAVFAPRPASAWGLPSARRKETLSKGRTTRQHYSEENKKTGAAVVVDESQVPSPLQQRPKTATGVHWGETEKKLVLLPGDVLEEDDERKVAELNSVRATPRRTSHRERRLAKALKRVSRRRKPSLEPDEALKAVVQLLAAGWRAESAETEVSVAMAQAVKSPRFQALKQLATLAETQRPAEVSAGHLRGTHVYYGSKIALRAQHGGYLALDSKGVARAALHNATPPTHFTLWNLSNLSDTGVVRYGDRVWLQCGRYEVLGTTALGRDVPAEWKGLLEDCAANINDDHKRRRTPDWKAYARAADCERHVTARVAATLAATRAKKQQLNTAEYKKDDATTLKNGPSSSSLSWRDDDDDDNHISGKGSSQTPPPPRNDEFLDGRGREGGGREVVGRIVALRCAGSASVFASAKVAGRWVVLNRREPYGALGRPVAQLDQIALQQEWLLASSRHPQAAELRVPENDVAAEVRSIAFAEEKKPATFTEKKFDREFIWTLHIVELSTTSNDEQKRIRRALDARTQVQRSSKYAQKVADNILKMRCMQHLALKQQSHLSSATIARSFQPHKRPTPDELRRLQTKRILKKSRSTSSVASPRSRTSTTVRTARFCASSHLSDGLLDDAISMTTGRTRAAHDLDDMHDMLLVSDHLACAKERYEACLARHTDDTIPREAATEQFVRELAAACKIQRFLRDRLHARWPWKLTRLDRQCIRTCRDKKKNSRPASAAASSSRKIRTSSARRGHDRRPISAPGSREGGGLVALKEEESVSPALRGLVGGSIVLEEEEFTPTQLDQRWLALNSQRPPSRTSRPRWQS